MEHVVDVGLQLLAPPGGHRQEDGVELHERLARELFRIHEERGKARDEAFLLRGVGEGLAAVRGLERAVEDVNQLGEAVFHDARDLRRDGRVDDAPVRDDMGEREKLPLVREDVAYRLARKSRGDVGDHRLVGEDEIRNEVLDSLDAADAVEREPAGGPGDRRLVQGGGGGGLVRRRHGEDPVVRLCKRDVLHRLKQILHLRGESGAVLLELFMVAVEGVAGVELLHVLAVKRLLGHVGENHRLVVPRDEIVGRERRGVLCMTREDLRREQARQAAVVVVGEPRDVPVHHERQDVLRRGGAQRFGFAQYLVDQLLHEILRGDAQRNGRHGPVLFEDDGETAVGALGDLRRHAAEREVVRMVRAVRKELERLREKLLESVPQLVGGLLALVSQGVAARGALAAGGIDLLERLLAGE